MKHFHLALASWGPPLLDLERLNSIRLSAVPWFQKVTARFLLMPNYNLPPRVKIRLEGTENIPNEPVIYAMNHTDKYNYWPFQYRLWRKMDRFTATWVKGKYYQHPLLGKFLEMTNNIPAASRGYLIAKDFKLTMGRAPRPEEYAFLRELVNHVGKMDDKLDTSSVPAPILQRARNILGVYFDPRRETYGHCIDRLFRKMMGRFVQLNEQAFELGLDVIIFPQGTRSKRLSKGRIGLGQIALKFKRPVVPVGCNGSDRAYPGNSPLAKGGNEITYRIGTPIRYEDVPQFHVDDDFEPFTPEAEKQYKPQFQGYVDLVMDKINNLLDSEYRYSNDQQSLGVKGTARFV